MPGLGLVRVRDGREYRITRSFPTMLVILLSTSIELDDRGVWERRSNWSKRSRRSFVDGLACFVRFTTDHDDDADDADDDDDGLCVNYSILRRYR